MASYFSSMMIYFMRNIPFIRRFRPFHPEFVEYESLFRKIVIITGGTESIGAELAKKFCLLGATVIVASRNSEKGEEICRKILSIDDFSRIRFHRLDLSDLWSVVDFVVDFKSKFDRLDILVNASNCVPSADFKAQTAQGYEMSIGVNYIGHYLLNRLMMDYLLKAKGKLLIVTCDSFISASAYGSYNTAAATAAAAASAAELWNSPGGASTSLTTTTTTKSKENDSSSLSTFQKYFQSPIVANKDNNLMNSNIITPREQYGFGKFCCLQMANRLHAMYHRDGGFCVNTINPGNFLKRESYRGIFGFLYYQVNELFYNTVEQVSWMGVSLIASPKYFGTSGKHFKGEISISHRQQLLTGADKELWNWTEAQLTEKIPYFKNFLIEFEKDLIESGSII